MSVSASPETGGLASSKPGHVSVSGLSSLNSHFFRSSGVNFQVDQMADCFKQDLLFKRMTTASFEHM